MALAALVSAGSVLALQLQVGGVRYDRFQLPAFDGHVYAAMAERPEVFTVPPWGFRLLTPALVHVLPVRDVGRGFAWTTLGGLAASGLALFFYACRIGLSPAGALLGVALLLLSPPVREVVRYQVLVEPATLLVEVLLLDALARGARVATLALLLAVGTLSKEAFVLLALVIAVDRMRHERPLRALATAALAAVPALLLSLLLRLVWTPQLVVSPWPVLAQLPEIVGRRVLESGPALGVGWLVGGLVPFALVGALRPAARPWLPTLATVVLVALLPPFLNPADFSAADLGRLLAYALPALVPLALFVVDPLLPRPPARDSAAEARSPSHGLARVPLLVTALLVAAVPFLLDPYRRIDLRRVHDAGRVLAVCRMSLAAARSLATEGEWAFDLEQRPYRMDRPDLVQLGRLRWFLWEGWEAGNRRGAGAARSLGGEARLLLPLEAPQPLEVRLRLAAPEASGPQRFGAFVNGRPVGVLIVGSEQAEQRLEVPAAILFRGDNLLELRPPEGGAALRLVAFVVRVGR